MKKIAKYFFAALATMAAMSCVKELNVEKPVELTGKAYEFTATIGDETKTTLDAETMTPMWLGDRSGNEYITVMEPNNLNTYVAEGIYEPTAEVTFVMAENGGAGLTGKSVFAVSPAEAAVDCFNNADSVGVTVNYNQIQYAYPETYDPAGPVAVAYNADVEANPHFSFKNASALLKFRVMEGSQEVTSVKFYSLGGEPLAGQMTLMEKGDSSMIVPAKGASNWVEIRGLYESPLDQDVDYYIAVAPALLKKGVGFQFNDGTHVETFTIEKEINIERNKIYDLGLLYYESNVDDKWYLVGNDASASNGVGTFSSMMFQAEGNNLVARNVTFAEKQSFRILNPAKKVSYYANAAGELEADTWIDLTEEASYAYYPEEEGTYDVYVDYVDGVITGVALVTPGEEAPEYLSPEGLQFTYFEKVPATSWSDAAEYHRIVDFGVCQTGVMTVGMLYDDYYTYELAGWGTKDPSLENEYVINPAPYLDMKVVPTNATSGVIYSMQTIESWLGKQTSFYRIEYSNFTGNTIDLYSPAQFLVADPDGGYMDQAYPVLDEDGNPLVIESPYGEMEATYQGVGAGFFMDDPEGGYLPVPVTYEVEEDYSDILFAVPDGNQFVWIELVDEMQIPRLLDLGVTNEGEITLATNYNYANMDPETGEVAEWADPRLIDKWVIDGSYVDYEIVPSSMTDGEIRFTQYNKEKKVTEYYLIEYTYYSYGQGMNVYSPAQFTEDVETGEVDEYGYPIYSSSPRPVLDVYGNVVRNEKGEDCYWNGIGIAEVTEWGVNPVMMGTPESSGFTDVELAPVPTTPDGAQWFFNWEGMAANFGLKELPTVIDLGVASEGLFLAIDQSVLYGGETDYFEYMSSPKYVVTPDPKNPEAGKISMIGLDMYGDEVVSDFATYEYFGGTMCHFVCESHMIDANAEIVREPFEITPNGAAMQ